MLIDGYRPFQNSYGVYRLVRQFAMIASMTDGAPLIELMALNTGPKGFALLRSRVHYVQTAIALANFSIEAQRATGAAAAATTNGSTTAGTPVSSIMPASAMSCRIWNGSGTGGMAVDAGLGYVTGALFSHPLQALAALPTTVPYVQSPPEHRSRTHEGMVPVTIYGLLPNGLPNSLAMEAIVVRLKGTLPAVVAGTLTVELEWAEFSA